MTDVLDIYVTCKDKVQARKIARHLIAKRLAACANMFPIESLYRWKGRIISGKEYAMLLKAPEKNFGRIEKAVKRLHSYDTPCIISLNVSRANKEYLKWISEECS